MVEPMISRRRTPKPAAIFALVAVSALVACKPDKPTPGTGIVSAEASVAAPPPEAGAVDITQCAGCQLAPIPAWTFEGIYRDATCTEPLAQLTAPVCAVLPAL